MRYSYGNEEVLSFHGFGPACKSFAVMAYPEPHWFKQFVVVASCPNDAIERLKANCRNYIEVIRKACKPEDFEEHEFVVAADDQNLLKARTLRAQIDEWREALDELGDTENDMANTRRETLTENIRNVGGQIQELTKPRSDGKYSKFSKRCEIMNSILSDKTQFTVEELSCNRVYTVAYFDDQRGLSHYIP